MAVKPVFASVWGTDKLMSSIDAISIGRPPEDGQTDFREPGQRWFHHDQGSHKPGRHAIQGAVYLAPTNHDDWCLRVSYG